jgi:cystathionine gamma-synthase
MGGAAIFREESDFATRVKRIQVIAGAVPSPFDCWLILRGVSTMPWRVRAHCENAFRVAAFLSQQSKVACVYYPGLESHPGYALAKQQMKAFGGMLSFQVKGDAAAAMKVAANVKLFTRATSLGGVESLIEHRASIEGPGTATPENLLRLSIGLEHPDDLIEDLAQALSQLP